MKKPQLEREFRSAVSLSRYPKSDWAGGWTHFSQRLEIERFHRYQAEEAERRKQEAKEKKKAEIAKANVDFARQQVKMPDIEALTRIDDKVKVIPYFVVENDDAVSSPSIYFQLSSANSSQQQPEAAIRQYRRNESLRAVRAMPSPQYQPVSQLLRLSKKTYIADLCHLPLFSQVSRTKPVSPTLSHLTVSAEGSPVSSHSRPAGPYDEGRNSNGFGFA